MNRTLADKMDEYRTPGKILSQRFERIENIVVKRDDEKGENEADIPGMAFTHFTRAGVPTIFALAKVFDLGGRMTFSDMEKVTPNGKQIVVLGQSIRITPYFHQRARIIFPVILRSRTVYVGNSSLSVENVVTDADYGDVLVSARRSFALMDRATGRSEKFPESIRKTFLSRLHKGMNQRVEILKDFPSKPKDCFEYPIHVRHSDTDSLYHSNQASYFLYCMDSATEGAKLGHFGLLKGDLLSYRIELLECMYRGESLPGDVLNVSVWENEVNPSELFSQIEKDGRVIWIGRIGFRFDINCRM